MIDYISYEERDWRALYECWQNWSIDSERVMLLIVEDLLVDCMGI